MQTISFMNMKGGVGKTTLAVNVAYTLAQQHDKKVLIVDCDPQFNASQYLLTDDVYLAHLKNPARGTLKDVFIPNQAGPLDTAKGIAKPINKAKLSLGDCTIRVFHSHTKPGVLDLVPSTLSLVEVQNSRRQTEARLKTWLKEKALHYDYVIIDCPPTISIFTEAAILASDKYIVPIKPDPLSVVGLPLLERYIQEFTEDVGMKIEQIGIILTQIRPPAPKIMKEMIDVLRKERKGAVFAEQLNNATCVAASVDAHQPILKYQRSTDKVKMQIIDITSEFIKRTKG